MKTIGILFAALCAVGCAGHRPIVVEVPAASIKVPPSNPPLIWLPAVCGFAFATPMEAICITEDAAGNQIVWPAYRLDKPPLKTTTPSEGEREP